MPSCHFCLPNDASDHTRSRTLLTCDKQLSKYRQRLAWAIYHSRREYMNFACFNVLYFYAWLRSHLKNSCFVFHQGFRTPRNNKNTRPATSCFHLFLGVWNSWWNTRIHFWPITSRKVSLALLSLLLKNRFAIWAANFYLGLGLSFRSFALVLGLHLLCICLASHVLSAVERMRIKLRRPVLFCGSPCGITVVVCDLIQFLSI